MYVFSLCKRCPTCFCSLFPSLVYAFALDSKKGLAYKTVESGVRGQIMKLASGHFDHIFLLFSFVVVD